MRISFDEAHRQGQDRFASNLQSVGKHKIADSYMKVAEADASNLYERGVTAGLLNNFSKIMDSAEAASFTKMSDFGPYVMEVWPLVTAWYPEFPLKDLISVQDMDKPLAYLFFSCLRAGTNKADTVVGDVVETATGPRTIRGRYPTGEIFGEAIAAADVEFDNTNKVSQAMLAYYPLNIAAIPGYLEKVKLVITDTGNVATTYIPLNVVSNEIHLATSAAPTTDAGVKINVTTGLITYPEDAGASATTVKSIVANYVWNLDYADTENIPRVKEEVEMVPMEAIPRALGLEWTLFSEYLKKTQFGQDIREDNTKRILNLLYQYQVRYILDNMYDYATGNSGNAFTITIPGGTAVSLDVKAADVMQQLKQCANIIEIASGRIEGNRIVAGKTLKSFLESLPNTWFKPTPQPAGFSAPREIGQFGTFKVYYDQYRDAGEGFMTYRGDEWYDAAYYLGEFMPIVPTECVALGVTVRSSFVSMEAYKFHKPTCVVKLAIS